MAEPLELVKLVLVKHKLLGLLLLDSQREAAVSDDLLAAEGQELEGGDAKGHEPGLVNGSRLFPMDRLISWQLTPQNDQRDFSQLAVVSTEEQFLPLILLHQQLFVELLHLLVEGLVRNVDGLDVLSGVDLWPDIPQLLEHLVIWAGVCLEDCIPGILGM